MANTTTTTTTTTVTLSNEFNPLELIELLIDDQNAEATYPTISDIKNNLLDIRDEILYGNFERDESLFTEEIAQLEIRLNNLIKKRWNGKFKKEYYECYDDEISLS